MASENLIFRVNGADHRIVLTDEYAPKTLQSLLCHLPVTADIHCAKIAGCHIMWPIPFVERVEKASEVLSMPPGSFFYWPERQYLEITYDELQNEKAAISYLGHLEEDAEWLRDYADINRREQGQKLFAARVFVEGDETPGEPSSMPSGNDAWSRLCSARLATWAKEPKDVQRLLDRQGLLIPYGPLSMAEAEMRKLHELLWRIWEDRTRYAANEKRTLAVFVIEAAITRVGSFCHMNSVGAVLEDGITCLEESTVDALTVLKELVLYCGRISAWLDLRICWWPMNEITVNANAGWPGN